MDNLDLIKCFIIIINFEISSEHRGTISDYVYLLYTHSSWLTLQKRGFIAEGENNNKSSNIQVTL